MDNIPLVANYVADPPAKQIKLNVHVFSDSTLCVKSLDVSKTHPTIGHHHGDWSMHRSSGFDLKNTTRHPVEVLVEGKVSPQCEH